MNNKSTIREITVASVTIGIVVGAILTAANVYLGLYAGMTVTASIPSAVIGMAIFRIILKEKNSVLQTNIVQTIASSGESLAAGVIFTVPALLIVGIWKDFQFWPTVIISLSGGILGIIFMIPLRKVLIIDRKDLTFPEGVACAKVIEAGQENASRDGIRNILWGIAIGSVFKFVSAAFGLIKGAVEGATILSNRIFYFGSDMSPALVGVGYIVGLPVALMMISGAVIGWVFTIPLLGIPENMASSHAVDIAAGLWSSKVRYMGVGAMIVAGIHSIISVRSGIFEGVKMLKGGYHVDENSNHRLNQNMSLSSMGFLFLISLAMILFLYKSLIGGWGLTILTTIAMVVMSFIFVAVASYIVGLVGSSNSPVSGMTISALMGTAALFLVFGYQGDSAILATLGVAAVVCCAACTSNDISQDLKTGYLVGASPRAQQWMEIVGLIVPAVIIPFVLTLLHTAYGIGDGLKAPQAMLFASLTQGLFGEGSLPFSFVWIGVVLGVTVIFFDTLLARSNSKYRLPLMPMAVGIYLPLSLSVPILLGGLVHYFVERSNRSKNEAETNNNGVLLSSGLIAGEGIVGVLVGALLYYNVQVGPERALNLTVSGVSETLLNIISLGAFAWVLWFLARSSRTGSR